MSCVQPCGPPHLVWNRKDKRTNKNDVHAWRENLVFLARGESFKESQRRSNNIMAGPGNLHSLSTLQFFHKLLGGTKNGGVTPNDLCRGGIILCRLITREW